MKILMVMTSHDRLGDTGRKTGVWLDEFASPYYIFKDARADIALASPKGGQPPIDPRSEEPAARTAATVRFKRDQEAQQAFANTIRLSGISQNDYDAVFYPGGHGPLWDLAEDPDSIRLIEAMYAAGKPVAAVCHGPAAFRHTKTSDGSPLVKDKVVTGFSNAEEEAVGLKDIVPFLVEDMLKQNGGLYSKGEMWRTHVDVDGNLITGQNPPSAEAGGLALLDQLIPLSR
jgi:putative intracellular protease/amidase